MQIRVKIGSPLICGHLRLCADKSPLKIRFAQYYRSLRASVRGPIEAGSTTGEHHVHHELVEPADEGGGVVELSALGQLGLIEQDHA